MIFPSLIGLRSLMAVELKKHLAKKKLLFSMQLGPPRTCLPAKFNKLLAAEDPEVPDAVSSTAELHPPTIAGQA